MNIEDLDSRIKFLKRKVYEGDKIEKNPLHIDIENDIDNDVVFKFDAMYSIKNRKNIMFNEHKIRTLLSKRETMINDKRDIIIICNNDPKLQKCLKRIQKRLDIINIKLKNILKLNYEYTLEVLELNYKRQKALLM